MEYFIRFEIERPDADGPIEVDVRIEDRGAEGGVREMKVLWCSDGYVLTDDESEQVIRMALGQWGS